VRAKRARAAVSVAVSLVVLTGCTTVYTGVGVRDPHADPDAVNAGLLDTGDFATKPSEPLGNATSRDAGALVEARRMADAVLVPSEIDARLLDSGKSPTPFGNPGSLSSVLYDNPAIPAVAGKHNFVAGFLTGRKATDLTFLEFTHIVMRFASPQDATDAAKDFAEHSETVPAGSSYTRSPHPIADHPDIRAFRDAKEGGDFRGLLTYTAHGPYVIADMISGDDLDGAVALAVASVDKQGPALDGFQATPVDELASMPLDPTGLQARTLPVPKDASNAASAGVYGAHGALHFMINPLRAQKLFDDTGLTNLSRGFAIVYETRDSTAAAEVADDIVAEIGEQKYPTYSPDEPVSGMPAARCLKPGDESFHPAFRCVVHVDRYAVEAAGPSSLEARRALAAQYVMLTAK